MDWMKVGYALIAVFVVWWYWQAVKHQGFKTMLQRARESPQHWGTYAFLIALIAIFIIFLIKL